jgi:two-component system CheB/CheR fusion protein
MSARVLREEPLAKRKILVAIVDVTEAKREGRALKTAKSEAEKANVGKSRFLAAASHDLRRPLQTISLLQGMLERRVHDQATLKLVHRLDETVSTMSNLLDKLLDTNQLEAGIVRPAVVDFSKCGPNLPITRRRTASTGAWSRAVSSHVPMRGYSSKSSAICCPMR